MNNKLIVIPLRHKQARISIFLSLCFLLFALTPKVKGETRNEQLEKMYETAVGKDEAMVGTAMAIVYENTTLFRKTSGLANLEHGIPVDDKTMFHWASVSKQFTGMAIAKLISEEKIALKDQVQKYVSELPTFSHPITIENLVYHTSGLREWSISLQTAGYGAAQTNDDVLRMLSQQQRLNFVPNSEFSYNNSGYTLLAIIVERVTGVGFNEYMTTSFFKPLDMKTAMFRETVSSVIANRARSYSFENEHNQPNAVNDELAITGASGLYANLTDMTKWANYIANLATSAPELFALIMTEGRLKNSHVVPYGFGFWRDSFYGTLRIDHTGSWAGFKAYTLYLPEKRFAVIGVRNFDESIWKIQSPMIREVLSHELAMSLETAAKQESEQDYLPFEASKYKELPGTYRLAGNAYINIEQSDSKLMVSVFPKHWGSAESSKKVELALNTKRQFVVPELNLTFTIDEKNNQQLLVKDSSSGFLVYTKLGFFDSKPEGVVGTYYSEELNTAFNVEFTDGQLYISNLRSGKVGLNHIAGLDFDGNHKIVDFVSFLPDSSGVITALEVSTERSRSQRFERLVSDTRVN